MKYLTTQHRTGGWLMESGSARVRWFVDGYSKRHSPNAPVCLWTSWKPAPVYYVRDHLEAMALAETLLDNHYSSGEPKP